jgi:hypothetical protein
MPLTLDQATALEHVGDTLYIGFNDDLERICFPRLQTVGGALIIEHNGALKEIVLPALVRLTKYLHIHSNAGLTLVELPKLRDVGGAFSLLDNPNLHTVKVSVGSAPVKVQKLEVNGCGKPIYPSMHVRA